MDDAGKNAELQSFFRIEELQREPVAGKFDVAHRKEIHRRIFQDSPQHDPGLFRPDAPAHSKHRAMESAPGGHTVFYAPLALVVARLPALLDDLKRGAALQGLDPEAFSLRMANLYRELDYLHPFREGNSRTLRLFTSQLARVAGYELDWDTAHADAMSRDRLYFARDREVNQLALPHLQGERAMLEVVKANASFTDRATLLELIRASLRPLGMTTGQQKETLAMQSAHPPEPSPPTKSRPR
ncbi:MAG: Fic family protein [Aestuariivirga sp.]